MEKKESGYLLAKDETELMSLIGSLLLMPSCGHWQYIGISFVESGYSLQIRESNIFTEYISCADCAPGQE